MPNRPLRPCAKHGCPALVQPPERYCQAHAGQAHEQRAEADRYYDTHQRDQQARSFYRSPEWEATRHAVLVRDHYLCQQCLRAGRITPTSTVHHKQELRKAWHLRLAMDNLEAICPECHNAERSETAKKARCQTIQRGQG